MATHSRGSRSYTMPAASHLQPSHDSHTAKTKKKPWQPRMPFLNPKTHHDSEERLSRENSHAPTTSSSRREKKWWKIRLFRGMVNDIRRRAPYYWSDWRDACDYRVVPATIYMYFAKYAPKYIANDYHGFKGYDCPCTLCTKTSIVLI